MNGRVRLIAVAVVAIVGCATPYQRQGFTGGFDEYPLAADTYTITFKGNAYTSADRVQMYLHFRCAELTLETGYNSFVVVEKENQDRTGQFKTQGQSTTTTTGTASVYGNTAYGSSQSHTTHTPGQTFNYKKAGRAATIRMYRGAKPEGAFDAREVVRLLGPRVGVAGGSP